MTRREFEEDINSWGDLIYFCSVNECSVCEYIYDEDAKDDYINDQLYGMVQDCRDWRDILDTLRNFPDKEGEWYYLDDFGNFCVLNDEDFHNYKHETAGWMDWHELWDGLQEKEEYIDEHLSNDDDSIYDNLVPISELFDLCGDQLNIINANRNLQEKQIIK